MPSAAFLHTTVLHPASRSSFPSFCARGRITAIDSGKASTKCRAEASAIGTPAFGLPAGSGCSSLFEPKRFEYPAASRTPRIFAVIEEAGRLVLRNGAAGRHVHLRRLDGLGNLHATAHRGQLRQDCDGDLRR